MPSSPLSLQSISGSDWLNTVAAGDITGELVAAVLPDLAVNPFYVKRSSDRRFVRDHCTGVAHGAGRDTTGEVSWGPHAAAPWWFLSAEEQQALCSPCPEPPLAHSRCTKVTYCPAALRGLRAPSKRCPGLTATVRWWPGATSDSRTRTW